MEINLLPNTNTSFRPFSLNSGYEPVTTIKMLKGDEEVKTESVTSFVKRIRSDWVLERENLNKSVTLQAKHYDQKHKDVQF